MDQLIVRPSSRAGVPVFKRPQVKPNDFNDAAMPVGVSYWVRLVEHCLPLRT